MPFQSLTVVLTVHKSAPAFLLCCKSIAYFQDYCHIQLSASFRTSFVYPQCRVKHRSPSCCPQLLLIGSGKGTSQKNKFKGSLSFYNTLMLTIQVTWLYINLNLSLRSDFKLCLYRGICITLYALMFDILQWLNFLLNEILTNF